MWVWGRDWHDDCNDVDLLYSGILGKTSTEEQIIPIDEKPTGETCCGAMEGSGGPAGY